MAHCSDLFKMRPPIPRHVLLSGTLRLHIAEQYPRLCGLSDVRSCTLVSNMWLAKQHCVAMPSSLGKPPEVILLLLLLLLASKLLRQEERDNSRQASTPSGAYFERLSNILLLED